MIADPQPLRKILAFNLIGSGVFLVFGIVARKGAAAGLSADPVPQAMVITGIVVAFAASAIAVALTLRLFDETGSATLLPTLRSGLPATEPALNDRGRHRHRGDRGRESAGAADPRSGCRRAAVVSARRPASRTDRARPHAGAIRRRVAIASLVWRSGEPLVYVLGGYVPPLGIALRADGFSAVMLVTASLIMPAAGLYARANFSTPNDVTEKRAPLVFWTLLQAI